MRKFRQLLLIGIFSTLALIGTASAQEGRKLVKKVPPTYPPMAKQFQISGSVKLEVTIGSDGSVKGTKVLAGHPMLTAAAVDAVSHWRYEAGAEGVETVVINFSR